MNRRDPDDAGYKGQVKDEQGARGRRLSEQQDVGELSAQNRGGTTARGLEESARLREDDREQAAQPEASAAPREADDESCDASAELNELFAQEDRPAEKRGKSAAKPDAADE
ncbi:MAG TPA: hypothetical protein VH253_05935 [Phycisphaerae bacterium]|nr:hypothetical protein [Phycisphaerae bacterium]